MTKAESFEYLKGIKAQIVNLASDSGELKLADITPILDGAIGTFEPKQGGGVSKNPPQIIDGVTFHYCRFFQDYMPEDEMVMSGGKSKGASIYASKYNYELGKQVQSKKEEALKFLTSGNPEDMTKGIEANAEALRIEASREKVETYKSDAFEEFKAGLIAKEEEKRQKAEEAKSNENGENI